MYRLWLIFSQATTVAVAVLFVVSTFRPEWLPTRSAPAATASIAPGKESFVPAALRAARADSYSDAVQKATPSVVNIFTSKQVRAQRNPLFSDPLFRRFFGDGNAAGDDARQRATSLGSGVIVSE